MTTFQQVYPFVPGSTTRLHRGQFWPILLPSGQYGAACVVGEMVNDGVKNSRLFIAGVLQWIGDSPPGAEQLSQIKLYRYGFLHIKSIKESGLPILGEANIDFADAPHVAASLELSTWGYRFPVLLCEQLCGLQAFGE
jgi:hypothetical protein